MNHDYRTSEEQLLDKIFELEDNLKKANEVVNSRREKFRQQLIVAGFGGCFPLAAQGKIANFLDALVADAETLAALVFDKD